MPRYFGEFGPDNPPAAMRPRPAPTPPPAPPAAPAPSQAPPGQTLPPPTGYAQAQPRQAQPAQQPPGGPPSGPPPTAPPSTTGKDFDPAWLSQNIDSRIDAGQWEAWKGFWDPAQAARDPGHPFRSENVDMYGNPIQGFFEKPVDCPAGTTKYGVNQCLPLDHPKVRGVRPGGETTPTPGGQGAAVVPNPGAVAPVGLGGAAGGVDISSILTQLLPLLMGLYGPRQATGTFLPGTNTQLNSTLPFGGGL